MSIALPARPSLLYPHMPQWVALLIACVSSFMVVMDGSIVNVALPSMQADLQLSPTQLQWVVDAYLLMLGGFMLLAARASDLFGRKLILQSGLLIFTLASLAGGLADSAISLLVARAVQGFGASALATSTLAVIVSAYPSGPAKARAISLWAASSAVASAMGVVIGGVLISQLSWRWVMFVNVPIGIVLIIAVAASLAPSKAQAVRLDLAGAVSITLGMGALMLGITQISSAGWATAQITLAVSALLLLGFILIEAKTSQPLIRLDIFKLANVRTGNLVVMGLGAALTSASFFISLILQGVLGYSPLQTGLAMLPMGITLAIAAIISRPMMDSGIRKLPLYGGLLSAAGLCWLSQITLHADFYTAILPPTLLIGLGLGLMLMTATHTALASIPNKDAGLASGLFNTARQLGAALGIALLSTLAHAQQGLAGYQNALLACALISALAAIASLQLKPHAA
ncbi:MFS transporter [Iodobacter sp. LRB]|uniref:MFS transporter n=1 Tax=unclassified Iodobacter TaxID=235634 RepID=UPI000C0ED95D|nr:MFS transporter [Iodobacter sp. BJB302]PHV00397.1 MFS transporter [Iodobacter sp. BJB302]